MKLHDLKPAPGSKKSRRRLGRGVGSGRGKTAGRGQKGQKSRSGFSQGSGWEGGRSRLIMRLPKRGFNHYRIPMQIVNLADLNRFDEGTRVDAALLVEHGLVRRTDRPVKLLGEGELEVRGLTVTLDAWSRSALAAVVASGGQIVGADAAPAESAEAAEQVAAEPANAEAPAETVADEPEADASAEADAAEPVEAAAAADEPSTDADAADRAPDDDEGGERA